MNGFDGSAWCDMPLGQTVAPNLCFPARLAGFNDHGSAPGGYRSIAEHMELGWSRPSSTWATALNGVSAQNFDTLSFRVAVVRPFGQEVEVTLTDMSGQAAMVKASQYSDALYQGPLVPKSGSPLIADAPDLPFADGQTNQVLNMVAIPLAAFKGVNVNSLKELRLSFPAQTGKVALADVQFQQFGR